MRYLLEKGANPEIADASGRKPIDMLSSAALRRRPLLRAMLLLPLRNALDLVQVAAALEAGAVNPATAAEIRALLQNAAKKK